MKTGRCPATALYYETGTGTILGGSERGPTDGEEAVAGSTRSGGIAAVQFHTVTSTGTVSNDRTGIAGGP